MLLWGIAFAGFAQAQFQFDAPTQLVLSGAMSGDFGPSLSSDNLTLYFTTYGRPEDLGGWDIWQAIRPTLTGEFEDPVILEDPINSEYNDGIPKPSRDGLSLYLVSNRTGTYGDNDVWIARRASTSDSFGEPVNLGESINTPYLDGGPDISDDELTLVINSTRPGGLGDRDLYLATRATTTDEFGDAVNLGPEINTAYDDYSPSLSTDGLNLFFSSDRPGGFGGHDLWVTSRESLSDPWGAPVNLGSSVNSASYDYNPEISWDGSRIVFTSDRGGVDEIYEAEIVYASFDFTGDGTLDLADLDELQGAVRAGTTDAAFDVNSDGNVDRNDVHEFVTRPDILNTWIGDANVDGTFSSADLVEVLAAGTYETDIDAEWFSGDFNTSGRFDSSDLVAALADGGYEQGPRAAANAVPEPASFVMLMVSLIGIAIRRRHVGP
jgi:hypothetical protein